MRSLMFTLPAGDCIMTLVIDGRAQIRSAFDDRTARESDGVALYARGDTARLISLDAWQPDSVWRGAARTSRSGMPPFD